MNLLNLFDACEEGNVERVKEFIEQGLDPNQAIGLASYYGNVDIVKFLLQNSRADPTSNNNYAIRMASLYGNTKVVEALLEDGRADPADDNNFAIEWTSNRGHLDVIKLLLQDGRVDPSDDTIYYAATSEIRELLLKYKYRVDETEYCRLKNDLASL